MGSKVPSKGKGKGKGGNGGNTPDNTPTSDYDDRRLRRGHYCKP